MATGAKSDFLENQVLDVYLRNGTLERGATVQAALYTASTGLEVNNPTSEVSGGSYARQNVSFGAPGAIGGAEAGTVKNSAEVTFPEATGAWGTVTHFAILDTSANVLYYGALDASRNVQSGDIFKFETDAIEIRER